MVKSGLNSFTNHCNINPKGNIGPFIQTFQEVEVHFYKKGIRISQGNSGYSVPASQRDVESIFSLSLINLEAESIDTISLWVKIKVAEEGNITIPLTILDRDADFARIYSELSQANILYGSYLTILMVGLLLWYWFREKIYIWFLFFLTTYLISSYLWDNQDAITAQFFPESPYLRPIMLVSGDAVKFTVLLLFGRVFIKSKLHFPKRDKIFLAATIGFTLAFFYFILQILDISPLLARVIQTVSFSSIFVLLCILVSYIFSQNKLAQFYSLGAVSPFVGIMFNTLARNVNAANLVFFGDFLIVFGPAFTISLALAYRFRLITLEREKAQHEQLKLEKAQSEQLQKINAASAKFVPSTFLNFLGKENILDATLGDYVEKQVSVLFSDIRDYTTLSEQMTPEENFRFVNAYNRRMGPIIQKHNGFVNQYLGDGLMAIFPENTEDTLKAAIAMQQILQAYNQTRISKNKIPIRMGIGIHAGPLIMGIIGDDQRMDAATISDTVNAASRVEGLTKYFGANILLSEAVVDNLPNRDVFNLRYLGLVQVKGKQEVIKIFECFDGDSAEVIELKKATKLEFKEGMKYYYAKKFDQGLEAFEKVLKLNPKDGTAQFFISKLTELKQYELDEDWTGVELMVNK